MFEEKSKFRFEGIQIFEILINPLMLKSVVPSITYIAHWEFTFLVVSLKLQVLSK